ncbi:hypothetical protein EVAR_12731_1 [Eumeta japonica]|uniref:Uncharacterized protein n=1 Tax=Eumeta variegata TaxID=151549 RepID=A0A4C1UMP2_EUMVA|nr:hypothetical protein EVAR_12731_1 [Eumeta japonica]
MNQTRPYKGARRPTLKYVELSRISENENNKRVVWDTRPLNQRPAPLQRQRAVCAGADENENGQVRIAIRAKRDGRRLDLCVNHIIYYLRPAVSPAW